MQNNDETNNSLVKEKSPRGDWKMEDGTTTTTTNNNNSNNNNNNHNNNNK